MLVAKESDVAKHLVAEQYHIVLACQRCHLLQLFFFPHYANGVLRVAHNHELGFLLNEHSLQVVEVHAIEMVASGHKVVAHRQAAIAFNHILEVIVYRLLQYYPVARTSVEVEHHSQGRHSTRHEGHLLTLDLETVATALPVDYRLPVLVVGESVSIDGVVAKSRY